MPGVAVAMDTSRQLTVRFCHTHLMHDIGMAIDAGILRYSAVARLDLNRFVEVFKGERQRMEETIVGLRNPLAQKIVGQVTVVTDRHMPMARVLPRVVMIVHHVAIGARLGIIAQVACALAVTKREYPDATQNAKHDG